MVPDTATIPPVGNPKYPRRGLSTNVRSSTVWTSPFSCFARVFELTE